MNVMRKYWDIMYLYILFFTPFECMLAAVWYTYWKYQGSYEATPWFWVLLFDGSQIIYIISAIFMVFLKKMGRVAPEKYISLIKKYITGMLLIQYSFIVFLFPDNYTWGCTFLFLILILFFFDLKYTSFNLFCYSVLGTLGHFIHARLYFAGENLVESVFFRIIIFVSYTLLSLVITYVAETFIRQMQEWEDDKKMYAEQQLRYYQNLDLMDKELRKFRHDIKNHFLCIQELTEREDLQGLKHYFHDLSSGYSKSEELYSSGNVIVDSILNYQIIHLCSSYVNPVIYGKLPSIVSVSAMDLCTVFSNMLSNAIKGANLLTGNNDLIIRFQGGERFFSICITNQISQDKQQTEQIHRQKDRNHGHGLKKILEVTERYMGKFEQTEDNETGIFIMQVYLPV